MRVGSVLSTNIAFLPFQAFTIRWWQKKSGLGEVTTVVRALACRF